MPPDSEQSIKKYQTNIGLTPDVFKRLKKLKQSRACKLEMEYSYSDIITELLDVYDNQYNTAIPA